MVAYLRKQQDILGAELQLSRQEAARLRNDAAHARRARRGGLRAGAPASA